MYKGVETFPYHTRFKPWEEAWKEKSKKDNIC